MHAPGDPDSAAAGSFDLTVDGIVAPGHGVAPGTGPDCPYPGGTILPQLPHFARRGLDLSWCLPATVNVDLAPRSIRMVGADHLFREVAWTDRIPPEDFSFSRCVIEVAGTRHPAWVYRPHPETKTEHFQPPGLLEILSGRIADLAYGMPCRLHLQSAHFVVTDAAPTP